MGGVEIELLSFLALALYRSCWEEITYHLPGIEE
jgi:hypothetical protein